jgi:peptidoglycan/LPS O-acetylase OafA/YrhL
MTSVLAGLGKPRVWVLALAAVLGAGAMGYYLLADHEILFDEPRRNSTSWVLGIAAFLLPTLFSRWISVWRAAIAMVGGAALAGTIWVFATGPGTLWPVAIVMIVLFAAIPVVGGALAAYVLQVGRRRSANGGRGKSPP